MYFVTGLDILWWLESDILVISLGILGCGGGEKKMMMMGVVGKEKIN
jgi:hypothetical protein